MLLRCTTYLTRSNRLKSEIFKSELPKSHIKSGPSNGYDI